MEEKKRIILEKFYKELDEEIKKSRESMLISKNADNFGKINEEMVENVKRLAFFNAKKNILFRFKQSQDSSLSFIKSKLFVKFKEDTINSKPPSDTLVNAKIELDDEYIEQKRVCNRLLFYDKQMKDVVLEIIKTSEALKEIGFNLRKEYTTY